MKYSHEETLSDVLSTYPTHNTYVLTGLMIETQLPYNFT